LTERQPQVPTGTKREILIDGDILIYQTALQNEEAVNWGDGLWTLHSYEDKCCGLVDEAIKKLKEDLQADRVKICLTSPINFRKDVLPTYKDNRKAKRKPLILPVLRKYIMEHHKGIMWDNIEADDVLGILATTPDPHFDVDKVIVSIDKDLKQIPVGVSSDGVNIQRVTPYEADYWFMTQALIGDAVDGYTGCPTVGIKTAEKILGTDINVPLLDLWDKVLQAYDKKGYTEAEALQQARCARILRHGEYNKKTGEVKLWQPRRR